MARYIHFILWLFLLASRREASDGTKVLGEGGLGRLLFLSKNPELTLANKIIYMSHGVMCSTAVVN